MLEQQPFHHAFPETEGHDEVFSVSRFGSAPLKAVLFDMDGVLFNSMPAHANAWHRAMEDFGLDLSVKEAYMHEGRTGKGTINIVARRQGMEADDDLVKEIYARKTLYFNEFPPAEPMPGALELLHKIQAQQLMILLVTGSGTSSLLARLEQFYPGIFRKERMVTGFDVKKGKPDPEPYLMGLQKGSQMLGRPLLAEECVVVENAPLGVEAAVRAGIPTIAVNTGPLDPVILTDAGARWIYSSMQSLCDCWED
ncbi:MAG: HAD hydrolase-like protein [Bacteroidaceae bacterium]|nr:HAD hydrolase-like protein [Bacteroidaceae bacterium]